MPTSEQHWNIVKAAGNAGWVAVRVNHPGTEVEGRGYARETEAPTIRDHSTDYGVLFSQTENTPTTFAEGFPRLTIALIAVALLAFTVTAEIEYLHGAGYSWGKW